MGEKNFFRELKRRNVYKVAIAYSISAWLLAQVAGLILSTFEAPAWAMKMFIVLLTIGFPIALILAWAFEMSPNGIIRTSSHEADDNPFSPEQKKPLTSNLVIGILILIVVGQFIYTENKYKRGGGHSNLDKSVAVLPFDNLSNDPGQEYFGLGLSEDLISALAKVPGFKVAARTSSFAFKDKEVDVREVGEMLGVRTVLDGSVRQTENELVVNVQLIDAVEGFTIWSESFTRNPEDVFKIQNEVAKEVVRTLGGKITATQNVEIAYPDDIESYNLYLKGRHAWNLRTESSLKSSVQYFEESILRSPEYAEAYTGIADAYAVLGFYDYLSPTEAFQKSRSAAKKALVLNPKLAQPHATLGYIALYYDWNWSDAEKEFLMAIDLDQKNAVAHQWYVNFLVAMGRFDEAERHAKIALDLDPLSLIINAVQGWLLYYARDYSKSIRMQDEALRLDENYALAHLWKAQALAALEDHEAALEEMYQTINLTGQTPLNLANLAILHALAGNNDEALLILADLKRVSQIGYVPSFEMAKAYLALGDPNQSLEYLDRSYIQRSHSMAFLRVDPQLDRLRYSPGFKELMRKVEFDQ